MRYKDPELMQRIRDFVDDYFAEEGRFPSTTEIGKAVGVSRGTAYRYLVEMDERGLISYDGSEILTEKIERLRSTQIAEVYTGSIPCGTPESVEPMVDDYVSLPTSIFGSGEMYVLRTRGDSMIEVGIEEGDFVVVKKQRTAQIGDIVVALTDEDQNTLKRLCFDKQQQCYYLHPENKEMNDIYVASLRVQGVATHVIKTL